MTGLGCRFIVFCFFFVASQAQSCQLNNVGLPLFRGGLWDCCNLQGCSPRGFCCLRDCCFRNPCYPSCCCEPQLRGDCKTVCVYPTVKTVAPPSHCTSTHKASPYSPCVPHETVCYETCVPPQPRTTTCTTVHHDSPCCSKTCCTKSPCCNQLPSPVYDLAW